MDKDLAKLMRQEEKHFGIQPGFQAFTPYPFGGMDQQSSRQGMEDNKFFYLENYLKTGPGCLRTLWDKGAALYTAPAGKSIIYFFFFNISVVNYAAVFLSDGTAVQVNTQTGAQTVISPTLNLFYAGTQLPACGQWGSQYLIIANNNTANDYWIWDGTLLYGAGTLGPIEILTSGGSGYTSAPTVTIYGGSGTGATATTQVVNGSVVSFTITNPGTGYIASDLPQVLFTGGGSDDGARLTAVLTAGVISSVTVVNGGTGFTFPPTLTVSGGGGSGAVLTAVLTAGAISSVTVTNGGTKYTTVPAITVQAGVNRAAFGTVSLMPFGISGTSIETFQQRVWLPHPNQSGNTITGGVFNVTAPGSITDFATSDGGLNFTNTDSFLRAVYTNIKQSNGYLYPIGDSSVSVISNVQTSGNPIITSFNYQNTDPQIGTSWRDSVQPYSRTILFANAFGVFGLYGGAVSKISQPMDNIFNNAIFNGVNGAVTPSSAVCNLFNLKAYFINMTIKDPFSSAQRTIMVGWDEKEWFIASQSSEFTFIGSQEINSDMFAWGTDGSGLYPLFNTPSASLAKKLSTKLYGNNNFLIQYESMGVYLQIQDMSVSGSGVAFSSVTVDAEHGSYAVPNIPPIPTAVAPYYPVVSMGSGDVFGVNLGLTLISNSVDYTINWLGIGYMDVGSVAMGSTPINGQIATE